jgi:hypothetical protein
MRLLLCFALPWAWKVLALGRQVDKAAPDFAGLNVQMRVAQLKISAALSVRREEVKLVGSDYRASPYLRTREISLSLPALTLTHCFAAAHSFLSSQVRLLFSLQIFEVSVPGTENRVFVPVCDHGTACIGICSKPKRTNRYRAIRQHGHPLQDRRHDMLQVLSAASAASICACSLAAGGPGGADRCGFQVLRSIREHDYRPD